MNRETIHINGRTLAIWPDMLQGSEDWFSARASRMTASQAKRIVTPTGKDSKALTKYIDELIAQQFAPEEAEGDFPGNEHTDRGHRAEPEALAWFEENTGLTTRRVGFVGRIEENGTCWVGCSPDALVYQNGILVGGIECKGRLGKYHVGFVREGGLPSDHIGQVHFSMAVMGIPWYFLSYHTKMEPYLVRAEPDLYTAKMEEAIDNAVIEYCRMMSLLKPKLEPKGGDVA